jgi:hypothetical protein
LAIRLLAVPGRLGSAAIEQHEDNDLAGLSTLAVFKAPWPHPGGRFWRDALHEASEVNHFNGAYNSAYNGASYRLRCMRSSEQYRVKQHTLLRHQRPYGMMFSSARRLVRVRQTLWAMETLY